MADKRRFKCRSFGGGAAYIPESKCLASEARYSPSSKYIVEGYDKRGNGNNPSVTNASNGAVISKLRKFSHSISEYILGSKGESLSCPSSAEYPSQRITAFTFEDNFGFTWPWGSNINYPKDFFNRGGTYAIGKNSSDYGVSKNPNKLCSDFRTEIDFHNVNYSFHKISVTKGKNRHKAVVDRNSITSYVDIFVNKADKPVLLSLSGHDPIVWKIHLEKGADLLGVFADGYHGKAVVGPKKSTPIFIHTKGYNPAINCSSIDFYAPFRREFDTTTAVRIGEQFVINGSYKGAKEYEFHMDYPLEKYELIYRHDK